LRSRFGLPPTRALRRGDGGYRSAESSDWAAQSGRFHRDTGVGRRAARNRSPGGFLHRAISM